MDIQINLWSIQWDKDQDGRIEEEEMEVKVGSAHFIFVSRDPTTFKAKALNQLTITSPQEQEFLFFLDFCSFSFSFMIIS